MKPLMGSHSAFLTLSDHKWMDKYGMNLWSTLQLANVFWPGAQWCEAWLARCPIGCQPPMPQPWPEVAIGALSVMDVASCYGNSPQVGKSFLLSTCSLLSCNHHSRWTEYKSSIVWKLLLGLPLMLLLVQVKLAVSLNLSEWILIECLCILLISSLYSHTSLWGKHNGFQTPIHPRHCLSIIL